MAPAAALPLLLVLSMSRMWMGSIAGSWPVSVWLSVPVLLHAWLAVCVCTCGGEVRAASTDWE